MSSSAGDNSNLLGVCIWGIPKLLGVPQTCPPQRLGWKGTATAVPAYQLGIASVHAPCSSCLFAKPCGILNGPVGHPSSHSSCWRQVWLEFGNHILTCKLGGCAHTVTAKLGSPFLLQTEQVHFGDAKPCGILNGPIWHPSSHGRCCGQVWLEFGNPILT